MPVLLTGWFSFDTAEVTAGDLLAGETVRRWLRAASIPHRVAMAANFRTAAPVDPALVDWTRLDPAEVDHLVFVCGPAAGALPEQLVGRFRTARLVLVGVSVVDGTAALRPDVVIERDSPGRATPDLSLGRDPGRAPVVGVILSHDQPEYAAAQRHLEAHRLINGLLLGSDVAPVVIDTRLHPGDPALCSTPAQLESVLTRLDAVVTTRLHGLVLSLKTGVAALAIDPIAGGGKVIRQARALAWPAALGVEEATPARLAELLAWVLTDDARATARRCVAGADEGLAVTRRQLLAALGRPAG